MKYPKKLIAAVTRYPRVLEVTQVADGRYEFRGIYAKYMEIVLSAWKGGYQIKFCEDEDLGTKDKNGTWSGQIGMVSKGEADIGMSLIGILKQRAEVVDFSTAYSMEAVAFASYKTSLEGMFQFLQLFDVATWIWIFVTIVILSVVTFLILRGKETFPFVFFNTFSNVLGKSSHLRVRKFKWKLFLAVWFLCAFVISSSYSAVLLSFLTLSPPSRAVTTLKDIAEAIRSGHRAFSGKHTFTIPFLINSEDEDLKFIGTSIRRNEWYHDWKATFAGRMLRPGDIYFSSRNILRLLYGNSESIHVSPNVLFVVPIAVAMNKNFCCASDLNEILLRIAAAGLEGKILKDESYKFWLENFSNSMKNIEKSPTLSVHDLSGAFIILLVGLILSLLVFSGEAFYGSRNRKKKQSKIRKKKLMKISTALKTQN
ncbi:lig_chan-Glu_bd domain-containing protein [Nephila pilipes]|uniref:Lig_chan-Glu_bd domain-containing protein n=1 Tax=Nephila pilipes TaxID=299642 RepID=A0A8X6N3W0_NEPPI|nr:lig_chan-Glu_bd domain-containing protein [Nephila pilipes]